MHLKVKCGKCPDLRLCFKGGLIVMIYMVLTCINVGFPTIWVQYTFSVNETQNRGLGQVRILINLKADIETNSKIIKSVLPPLPHLKVFNNKKTPSPKPPSNYFNVKQRQTTFWQVEQFFFCRRTRKCCKDYEH